MSIDFDTFYEWAINRFGTDSVKIRHTAHGDEICTHSPFALKKLGEPDNKYHLWMNPAGGKKERDHGVFRCWLTDEMGSLVSLVSEYDNIPYEEAEELLGTSISLRNLEQKLDKLFGTEDVVRPVVVSPKIVLPPYTYIIDDMPPSSRMRIRARQYLRNRMIPSEGLYVCTDGDYKNRIVIPYYNRSGELVWFNARTMDDRKNTLRYMKPAEGDQKEILFMTDWPNRASKIYIMEGEFDAITIKLANLIGCACGGKYLSPAQIEIIRGHVPVLSFDADESGFEALCNVGRTLLEIGFGEIRYIRPPKEYKDWNKLLQVKGVETIINYIKAFEKPLTEKALALLELKKL